MKTNFSHFRCWMLGTRHLVLNRLNSISNVQRPNSNIQRPTPRTQAGDTLIEVVVAVAILGIILFNAYSLSNRAFKIGVSARERSQAAQLLQEQAEGLRALRDSQAWDDFRNDILIVSANGTRAFHIEKSSGQWQATQNGATDWNPWGGIPNRPQFYSLNIRLTSTDDPLRFTITINWDRFGGGNAPRETSALYYALTNRELSF